MYKITVYNDMPFLKNNNKIFFFTHEFTTIKKLY